MHLPVASIFLCAAATWLLGLSVIAMLTRRQQKVALGEGNNPTMQRAMRAQANAAEYLPMMGLLMLAAEVQGAPQLALQGLGGLMLLGRLSHAYGLLVAEPKAKDFKFRVAGMACTWSALGFGVLLVFVLTTGLFN
jgi:uncharacterized membrane protein YecN with MAPEG domain